MNQFNPYYNKQYYPAVNTGITWVSGIEGAKAYQLAPNSNAILLDSEREGMMYIKVADNIGMCSLRCFRYEEIKDEAPATPAVDLSEYVKRSELQELINGMRGESNEQSVPATKRRFIE